MSQPECKYDGCPRTAIPGRSPHGYCLQHEKEYDSSYCPVDGCENHLPPNPNARLCDDCAVFLRKMYWLLNRVKITKAGEDGKPKKIITVEDFKRDLDLKKLRAR